MLRSKGLWKDELKEKWREYRTTHIAPSKVPLSSSGADRIFDEYIKRTVAPYRENDSPFSVTGEIRGADGFSATFSVVQNYVRGPESELLRMGAEELYQKAKLVPTEIRVSVEDEECRSIGRIGWGLLRNDLTQQLVPGCVLQFSPGSYYLSHLSETYYEGLPRALRFLAEIGEVASRHSPGDEPWVY